MAENKVLIRTAELKDVPVIMELEQGSIAHPWESRAIEGVETVLDEGNVGNIVTHKEYRGRGFAKELFTRLLEDAKEKGIEKLFLEVESDNVPALGLYEKLGFGRYGLRRGYYGQDRDAVLMLKNL